MATIRSTRFLTAANVQTLHRLIMGMEVPLSQPSMLSSACESPANLQHYTGETNKFQLASHLAEKVARNHPFQDGNKRTSLLAADVFLRLNGAHLNVGGNKAIDELADAQVNVVTCRWSGEKLGRYYEQIGAC